MRDHLDHLAPQDMTNYTSVISHTFISCSLQYPAIDHWKAGTRASSWQQKNSWQSECKALVAEGKPYPLLIADWILKVV